MTLKTLFISFSLAAILAACQPPPPELGAASPYFPSPSYLQKGIVNKYYLHHPDENGYDINTDIQYRSYHLSQPDEITVRRFNPAIEPIKLNKYLFEDDKMKVIAQVNYFRGDTLRPKFSQNERLNFGDQSAYEQFQENYPSGAIVSYEQKQVSARDTLIDGRQGKVFLLETTQQSVYQGDTAIYEFQFETTYLEGIGLYSYVMHYDKSQTRLELVEQMSLEEFRKRSAHEVKRIGFIDPERVLDKEGSFSPCQDQQKIYDYYNGSDKKAQYKGGKRAIWELMNTHLDAAKIANESGYLTLRFVVNCQGEAGWFTMEEADLDFQSKQFPAETIQHFFEILYQHPNWKPVIIRGEKGDAYTYLTFKLKQGELIEILP